MELQEFLFVALTAIGFISVCKSFVVFVRWVWLMFLRPPKNLKDYGSWALVTGSADGIGRALAFKLASKGLNLVLLDRNAPKLESTSNEIHEKYGGQVEMKKIVMDLSKFSGEEIASAIEEGIKGLDVGILVNNAGVCQYYGKYFHEIQDSELMESIKVNVGAATWITKAVLPKMLKKKKGAIVNMGSASAHASPSFPLYTLYATSKAYLSMLSRSLSVEYKKHGIDIQCQVPLFVATRLSRFKVSPLLVPSAETYSEASIRCIGYEQQSCPYWPHSLQWFIASLVPDELKISACFSNALTIRKRGELKKKSQANNL